jgi:hypothetical protein
VEGTTERTPPESAAAPASAEPATPSQPTNLSDEGQVSSLLTAGLRSKFAASRDESPAAARPDAKPDSPPVDKPGADDEDDDHLPADAPSDPPVAGEPSKEPVAPSGDASAPAPKAETRGERRIRERNELIAERDEARRERDEARAQVTNGLARVGTLKPEEADAVLTDAEFDRLAYIDEHGAGLNWEDTQKLETAKTLRKYRDVWIADGDQRATDGLAKIQQAVSVGIGKLMAKPGIGRDAIAGADSFEAIFERAYDVAYAAGASAKDAEHKETIAQLQRDNTALSAQAAGRTRQLEVGGRTAPVGAGDPGPNADPQEQMAAGIRARSGRANGRH